MAEYRKFAELLADRSQESQGRVIALANQRRVGQALAQARIAAGLTEDEVAARSELSPERVEEIELTGNARPDELSQYAAGVGDGFRVSIDIHGNEVVLTETGVTSCAAG